MGDLIFEEQPISASDASGIRIQMQIRPGEQWDPKCESFTDGLLYMAAQSDFDGTKEYFDRELNKLIAEQCKPLCRVDAIPTVDLTELNVSTAGYDDYYGRLGMDTCSTLKRYITNEITATMTLNDPVVDPLLFAMIVGGLPVRVVPKDQCCQPLAAVPARPHKKKRIRKKWLKKYGWKIIYGPEKAWIFKDPRGGDVLYVGPDTYKTLRETGVDVKDVATDD